MINIILLIGVLVLGGAVMGMSFAMKDLKELIDFESQKRRDLNKRIDKLEKLSSSFNDDTP